MATGVEWLQKQKKSELAELAGQVGMKSYERMKKSELEVALEDHLRTHQSSYASNPSTAAFYQGVDPASPVKHRGGKAVSGGKAEDEKKPRQRRQTMKAKEEAEGYTSPPTSRYHPPTAPLSYTHKTPKSTTF
ncbi:uncharacterized protein KY384_008787 [Bacidia gigantensis]|uniref:uncharacterized protein n=1 Tax=Bacidia gigantensis TaxID=2732470 RepID=UPI001D05BDAD|nr:uncharacterized protein KY384_008787 [Bacidia gigantensis]KAG8526586.1 hypothetical protein KY384_008787 [Bacidia gigantensis]